jgi:hypothetical protein
VQHNHQKKAAKRIEKSSKKTGKYTPLEIGDEVGVENPEYAKLPKLERKFIKRFDKTGVVESSNVGNTHYKIKWKTDGYLGENPGSISNYIPRKMLKLKYLVSSELLETINTGTHSATTEDVVTVQASNLGMLQQDNEIDSVNNQELEGDICMFSRAELRELFVDNSNHPLFYTNMVRCAIWDTGHVQMDMAPLLEPMSHCSSTEEDLDTPFSFSHGIVQLYPQEPLESAYARAFSSPQYLKGAKKFRRNQTDPLYPLPKIPDGYSKTWQDLGWPFDPEVGPTYPVWSTVSSTDITINPPTATYSSEVQSQKLSSPAVFIQIWVDQRNTLQWNYPVHLLPTPEDARTLWGDDNSQGFYGFYQLFDYETAEAAVLRCGVKPFYPKQSLHLR